MPSHLTTRHTFVIAWLLAHLVSGAAAGMVEVRLEFLGTLILAGIPVAMAQGLYLRIQLPRARLWALTLAVGWPVAHLLYTGSHSWPTFLVATLTTLPFLWELFWINFIRLSFVMLLVGMGQWLFTLRSYRRSPFWPMVSLLGGALLGGMNATICRFSCDQLNMVGGPLLVGTVLGALGWGTYALVTGPFLANLLAGDTQYDTLL